FAQYEEYFGFAQYEEYFGFAQYEEYFGFAQYRGVLSEAEVQRNEGGFLSITF
ncbi:MAG: hypothetical protein ACJA1A_003878, partial [Saprospiraceae bacterium]